MERSGEGHANPPAGPRQRARAPLTSVSGLLIWRRLRPRCRILRRVVCALLEAPSLRRLYVIPVAMLPQLKGRRQASRDRGITIQGSAGGSTEGRFVDMHRHLVVLNTSRRTLTLSTQIGLSELDERIGALRRPALAGRLGRRPRRRPRSRQPFSLVQTSSYWFSADFRHDSAVSGGLFRARCAPDLERRRGNRRARSVARPLRQAPARAKRTTLPSAFGAWTGASPSSHSTMGRNSRRCSAVFSSSISKMPYPVSPASR